MHGWFVFANGVEHWKNCSSSKKYTPHDRLYQPPLSAGIVPSNKYKTERHMQCTHKGLIKNVVGLLSVIHSLLLFFFIYLGRNAIHRKMLLWRVHQ